MTTEVLQPTFIEQELKKFDVVEANLIQLAEAGKGLKIASIEDKAGTEAVRKARIAIKNERVRIEKKGKELREQATKFNKAVLAKEKEYLAIIAPTEDELQAEENKIEQEKIRIEAERKEAEQKKVQDRINQLSRVGYVIDYQRAASMDAVTFAIELSEATKKYEAEQKQIAEDRERIRLEAERLAEANRLHELRVKEAAELAARVKKEQDDKQRELELAAQKVCLEQEAVENQRKQQIEHERQLQLAAEREKQIKEQAEKDRIEAAEKAERDRIAAIEAERLRIEKEAADKAEAKRKAEAAAKKKAQLAPDKEKLTELAKAIDTYK